MEAVIEIMERFIAKMQRIDAEVVDSDDGSAPVTEEDKLSLNVAIERLTDDYHSLLGNLRPVDSARP